MQKITRSCGSDGKAEEAMNSMSLFQEFKAWARYAIWGSRARAEGR